MKTRAWLAVVAGLMMTGIPEGAVGQTSLDDVVRRAADAWGQHRTRDLVVGSDTVRLNIPGVAASAAVRPGQATRVLDDYLADAEELAFELVGIRYVAADHAYAEFARRFRVRGTDDGREQTVFLGYRLLGGEWRLREVRVAP